MVECCRHTLAGFAFVFALLSVSAQANPFGAPPPVRDDEPPAIIENLEPLPIPDLQPDILTPAERLQALLGSLTPPESEYQPSITPPAATIPDPPTYRISAELPNPLEGLASHAYLLDPAAAIVIGDYIRNTGLSIRSIISTLTPHAIVTLEGRDHILEAGDTLPDSSITIAAIDAQRVTLSYGTIRVDIAIGGAP